MKAVIDGNNVFRYGEGFNVHYLNTLFKALDKKEIDWFCYTDANMGHLVNMHCNAHDRNLFGGLLEKYKGRIASVPAGRRADSYILQKADKEDAVVISNDKFRDFEYVSQYPWLMNNPWNLYRREVGRCVYPFVFQEGRLQIYELDIYAIVDYNYNLSPDGDAGDAEVVGARIEPPEPVTPFPRSSTRYWEPLRMITKFDRSKRPVESETTRMLRRMSQPQKLSPLQAILCGVVGALVIAKGIKEG